LRANGDLKLVAYMMAGHPNQKKSIEVGKRLAGSGIAALEIGIPFSDPLADGRTIQAASQAALRGGVTVAKALEAAAAARAISEVPMLFMSYLNPILAFGSRAFCRAAKKSGVDGLIVPDLPPAEASELRGHARESGLELVFFVAPTSSPESISAACAASTAFVYCIAVTGVTGARQSLDPAVLPLIENVRNLTSLPIVVGFGISLKEHLDALEGHADGAIIASALLDEISKSPGSAPDQVARFLLPLRRGAPR
jgi:tryptophan synthase alpha chain